MSTIVNLVFAVPTLIVLIRWLWPLPLPLWVKIATGFLMLAASQFHLWSRVSSGSVFAPEFPRPFVILFNWAFGALLLLTLFQLVLDLGALVTMMVRQVAIHQPAPMRYAAAGLAAVLAAIGVANALRVPPVRDVTVMVRDLPPSFDGYRIVQLTDLHISRLFTAGWAQAVVERTNAAGADLTVVTGDFIDGSLAMRRADVQPLRRLSAPDGVYAIPGNHEYFFNYGEWMRHLAAMGFHLLTNAHAVIERGGDQLVIAGVTDLSARGAGEAAPDLGLALRGAPAGVPIILLDHQPRNAPAAAARCRAPAIRAYAWRDDRRAGPAGRAWQCRFRIGPVCGRRHDAVCQQRHRAVAGLRAPAGRAIRDHPVHLATPDMTPDTWRLRSTAATDVGPAE